MRALLVMAFFLVAGCGPDARRVRAAEALEEARTALLDVATSGGEAVAEGELAEANARLEEAEHAYDIWGRTGGDFPWQMTSACLSVALDRLGEALERSHHPLPIGLESATTTMGSFAARPCGGGAARP